MRLFKSKFRQALAVNSMSMARHRCHEWLDSQTQNTIVVISFDYLKSKTSGLVLADDAWTWRLGKLVAGIRPISWNCDEYVVIIKDWVLLYMLLESTFYLITWSPSPRSRWRTRWGFRGWTSLSGTSRTRSGVRTASSGVSGWPSCEASWARSAATRTPRTKLGQAVSFLSSGTHRTSES